MCADVASWRLPRAAGAAVRAAVWAPAVPLVVAAWGWEQPAAYPPLRAAGARCNAVASVATNVAAAAGDGIWYAAAAWTG
eukprot:gene12213-21454_t